MVYANNNDVRDGGCETDSDSDYEEDPTSPTVARTDSSVQRVTSKTISSCLVLSRRESERS